MLHLFLLETEKASFDFASLLSKEELFRAEKMRNEKRKKEFILSHSLLRLLRRKILNFENEEISYSEYGKPTLTNSNFDFSISHADGLIAVVISDEPHVRVGVDVQKRFSNIKSEKQIEERFLKNKDALISRESDLNIISKIYTEDGDMPITLKEKDKVDFLNFWTRAEAILKMSGVGFSAIGDIENIKAKVKSFEFFDYTVSVATDK